VVVLNDEEFGPIEEEEDRALRVFGGIL